MSNVAELAIPYAVLALHDDNIAPTEENINKLLAAAGIEVEAVWVSIFARALAGRNLGDLLNNVGAAAAAPAASSAPAAAAPAAEKKEDKKKEEKKKESDEDMGFSLFD